ncbi:MULTISPECIES: XRE family transcriptional regulator [unclassified Bradyrhizobium]|uniref:LexA family protein n=1 Tax=unclassified Bradyrhizobium TaxID=2631580 RepID=UPI0028EEC3C8|nr:MULTISPECIES: XRE family transcriptional regulator [unclassified Bradyrhizobium]
MSDTSLAQKIRALRARKELTGEALAHLIGATQASVSRWEKGIVKPKGESLKKLAQLAGETEAEFLYGRQIGVPLLSWVSAGKLLQAQSVDAALRDDVERIGVSGLGPGDFFALRVKGDSMNKIAPDGSIVIVNRAEREPIDRKFFIFLADHETTFKRFRANPTRLEPYSYNPEHETIYPDHSYFSVLGRVRRVQVDDL